MIELDGREYRYQLSAKSYMDLCRVHGPIVEPKPGDGGRMTMRLLWNFTQVDLLFDVLAAIVSEQKNRRVPATWVAQHFDMKRLFTVAGEVQLALFRELGLVGDGDEEEQEGEAGPLPEQPAAASKPTGS